MPEILNQKGEVVELFLSQIKPYHRNPRINEKSVKAVAESIKNYGYNQLIVVDPSNTIIVGHTRFKALKFLEVTEALPVLRVALDAQKIKQYRIADNKAGEQSTWDDEKLIQELRETELSDMQIFFPETNLNELIKISTGSSNWKDVTESDFSKTQLAENLKIVDLTAKREAQTQTVTCPHCLEDFEVR